MRSVWSCSSCVGLLFLALLGETTRASHAGRQKQYHDSLHWVAKAQVTERPFLKRDEGTCPQGNQILCPASLSGGCCPVGYECHTDSCYATTAGPTTACGKANYFACKAEDSGGCCPVGFVCGPTSCTPPAGITNTHTSCPVNYYLCPASVNFGCCRSGMGCGVNECYSTTPVTTTVTRVITTTSGDETITTTRTAVTVATPAPPTDIPTSNFVPKFIPTVVAKISEIPKPSKDDGGGLSKAQLGGIVGGVVALLLIVIVATVLIIRRLKRTADVVESQKDASSGVRTKSQSHAQMAYYGGQLHISSAGGGDMDNMSIDPLMVTPNTNMSGSGTGTPQQFGGGMRDRSDSETGFSPLAKGRGDSVDASGRHISIDSAGGGGGGGYFDLLPRVQNIPGGRQQMSPAPMRGSVDSHATTTGQYSQYTYQHWRQQSNASELSADGGSENGGGVTSPLVPELDSAGAYAELPGGDHHHHHQDATGGVRSRSSSITSPRAALVNARRRSESNGARTAAVAAVDSTVTPVAPLDVVSESSEIMHGYYGPRDKQAGQTAAGLTVDWDISSPTVAAAPLPEPILIPTQLGQAQGHQEQHQELQHQQPPFPPPSQ